MATRKTTAANATESTQGAAAPESAAASTTTAAPDNSKLRKHEDLDAALSGRDQPEGWAEMTVKQKQEWHGANPAAALAQNDGGASGTATAPQVAAEAGTTSIAEATQAATTEENPASTTKANDPARDATVSNTTTAERLEGVEQEPNSNDLGAAANGAGELEHNDEQAAGNRHSHSAETEAERTSRLAQGADTADLAALSSQALPAGEDADPANQPAPGEGVTTTESRHDESGTIQDATRLAIGAGNGAPDGVGDDGADPSEAEVNALADKAAGKDGDEEQVQPGMSLAGGQLKLWRALEKGATQKEMLEATGWRSVLGTVDTLSRYSGREVVKTRNGDDELVYTFKPLPDTAASV